jgi:multidrug resistance efflux pump
LAKESLAEAQHTFDQTKSGVDPDALQLAQMRLEAATAQQAAAQAALDNLELKAPFAGTVVDVNVLKDEQVSPGSWAFLLADTSQWNVLTSDLTELEVVNLEVGQQVEIVPDALPDVKLSGVIEEISDTYTSKSGDIMYEVKIRLDETDPQLRWGMTVEANFAEK